MSKNYVTSFTKELLFKSGDENVSSKREQLKEAKKKVYAKAIEMLRDKSDFSIIIPDSKLKKTPMHIVNGISMLKGYLSVHNQHVDEMRVYDMSMLQSIYSVLGRNRIRHHITDIRIPHYRMQWDEMFTDKMYPNHGARMQHETSRVVQRYLLSTDDISTIGYKSRKHHTMVIMGDFDTAYNNTFMMSRDKKTSAEMLANNVVQYLRDNPSVSVLMVGPGLNTSQTIARVAEEYDIDLSERLVIIDIGHCDNGIALCLEEDARIPANHSILSQVIAGTLHEYKPKDGLADIISEKFNISKTLVQQWSHGYISTLLLHTYTNMPVDLIPIFTEMFKCIYSNITYSAFKFRADTLVKDYVFINNTSPEFIISSRQADYDTVIAPHLALAKRAYDSGNLSNRIKFKYADILKDTIENKVVPHKEFMPNVIFVPGGYVVHDEIYYLFTLAKQADVLILYNPMNNNEFTIVLLPGTEMKKFINCTDAIEMFKTKIKEALGSKTKDVVIMYGRNDFTKVFSVLSLSHLSK